MKEEEHKEIKGPYSPVKDRSKDIIVLRRMWRKIKTTEEG